MSLEQLGGSILARLGVAGRAPWVPADEAAVERELRSVVQGLCAAAGADSRVEWDHYGAGYASYVDAWLYRADGPFRRPGPTAIWTSYTGLVVLVCRLGPAFCLMEGERSWTSGDTQASYLPSFELLDELRSDAVRELAGIAERFLVAAGYTRLRKADVSAFLPSDLELDTNLGDPPYREFDVLFHWYD